MKRKIMLAIYAAALILPLIALFLAYRQKDLPCPNCGAPLRQDGNGYSCTEPHCGYHS